MTDGTTKPRGRPKGARARKTILREIARRMVTTDRGETMTVLEALIRKASLMAMSGDVETARYLDRLRGRLDPDPGPAPGILLVPGALSEEEWRRQEEIRDRFREPPAMPDAPPAPAKRTASSSAGAVDKPVEQPRRDGGARKLPSRPDMRSRLIR